MITVFSAQDNEYHRRQVLLLRRTFREAGMPGTLEEVFHGESYPYAGMNKVEDLSQWALKDPASTETVLVIDPDFIFVSPIERVASPGHAYGQPLGYMGRRGKEDLLAKYTLRPELVAPVGVPIFICRSDLAAIAREWKNRTRTILSDPHWGSTLNWVTDMWAYCLVAADLGITHEPQDLCAFPDQPLNSRSMIHYCYDTPLTDGGVWSKRRPGVLGAEALTDSGRFLVSTLRDTDA